MTKQLVIYNGGTESYRHADNPKDLVVGKIYTITHRKVMDYQTNLRLKEFPGKEFNSVWFSEPKCYIAKSLTHPKIGEKFYCQRYENVHGSFEFHNITTSIVSDVIYVGNNIYLVKTQNSLYFCEIH